MAKLKARGRQEIFRVKKEVRSGREGVALVTYHRALMSDGSLLERMVIEYTPEEIAKNYGKRSHDYGWKVKGSIKPGVALEPFLQRYLEGGWQLEHASDSYFVTSGDSISAVSSEPLIDAESAARREKTRERSRERAKTRREESSKVNDGPGFYVTNAYTGGALRSRIADHERPFATLEEALELAERRLRRFTVEFDFRYLLPVIVIESGSRREAISGIGHVWWIDGKYRGPLIDQRQTGFGF
jgi:hypothetical protein